MVKSFVSVMRRLGLMAVIGAPFILGAATAQASLIINGGFESYSGGSANGPGVLLMPQLPGWGINGSVEAITTYWKAADGAISLDLNGAANGGVWQKFATQIGATYKVNFMLAGNPAAGGQKSIRASAGDFVNDYIFSSAGKSTANMGWTEKEFQFTALAASTTLTFQSLVLSGSFGPALDNVRVELVSAAANVPEPASAALVGGALIGLAGLRRKRRA